MRASPPLTYSGALALLDGRDHPILDIFDRLAGAGILLGGVIFPPVLGLVDAKQELVRLVRDAADRAASRLTGARGRERLDLIGAAHTTLVLSSLFDSLAAEVGPRFASLKVSDAEKLRLASSPGDLVTQREWIDALVAVDLPLPGPTRGFEENLEYELRPRVASLANRAVAFLDGLQAWQRLRLDSRALRQSVVERCLATYRSSYVRLAADIPEFFVWSCLGEHGATRTQLEATEVRLTSILRSQSEALGKLHDLLAAGVQEDRPARHSYRSKLSMAAAAVLGKPLLRTGAPPAGLILPTVTAGFVTPRFRTAVAGPSVDASQEAWWQDQPIQDGLDEFLAAHLAHPDAARAPLIVLGHPGAGKSLLTDVLAARLPVETFTVVPVQLRRVNADDRIHDQVETALHDLLHEHVSWGKLADETADLIRVVILDGFDELVQATGAVQSSYLSDVRRFQEQEYDLGRAVAVVVTSRTLVVDRARIPPGSLLVKLEDFDDAQVGQWAIAWNGANSRMPGFRPLELAELLHHGSLARQPLLLTMLAIYAADPEVTRLDAGDLSTAALYQRLLDSFIRRQVADKPDRAPAPEQLPAQMADHRWRLSIAAFSMFNRGRQYVTDDDLDRDLEALLGREQAYAAGFGSLTTRARQTVANFFFVHVARADEQSAHRRQTYEFLHATFGEFLIAERALRLVEGYAARRALYQSDPSSHEAPDDSLLRAVLSHEPLVQRRPVVDFAEQLLSRLEPDRRRALMDAVAHLLASARRRSGGIFDQYQPTAPDVVRAVAAYTANLVVLAVLASADAVALETLAPIGTDTDYWVRSTVRLWAAGLEDEAWASIGNSLIVGRDGRLGLWRPTIGDSAQSDGSVTSLLVALADLDGRGKAIIGGPSTGTTDVDIDQTGTEQ